MADLEADIREVRLPLSKRLGETLGLPLVAAAAPLVLLLATGPQHFMLPMVVHAIVLAVAGAGALAASLVLTAVGARRGDTRAVLVGVAFSVMSSMLLVHGLASPGVIVGPNGLVQLAGAGNLPAGTFVLGVGPLLLLRRPNSTRLLLAVQGVLLAAVAGVALVGMLDTAAIPVMPGPGGHLAHLVMIGALLLVGSAAHRAARTFLLTHRRADLAVVVGLAWMGVALIGLLEYPTMQLGFWLAHVFEVGGLVLVGAPAAVDLRRGAQSYPLVGDLSVADLVRREETFLGPRVRALMLRLAEKDAYTERHTRNVALLAVQVGERVGLAPTQLRSLAVGGLLHDMGKLSVPDEILQKPGALDDDEFEEIRRHPANGERLLRELGGFGAEVHGLVLDHHERLDGKGYPRGLDASRLDLPTRVLTVCDVYDALISKRVYRDAWPSERALGLLRSELGTAFDARCVEALEAVVGVRRAESPSRVVAPARAALQG